MTLEEAIKECHFRDRDVFVSAIKGKVMSCTEPGREDELIEHLRTSCRSWRLLQVPTAPSPGRVERKLAEGEARKENTNSRSKSCNKHQRSAHPTCSAADGLRIHISVTINVNCTSSTKHDNNRQPHAKRSCESRKETLPNPASAVIGANTKPPDPRMPSSRKAAIVGERFGESQLMPAPIDAAGHQEGSQLFACDEARNTGTSVETDPSSGRRSGLHDLSDE